jgi:hypothetical protein
MMLLMLANISFAITLRLTESRVPSKYEIVLGELPFVFLAWVFSRSKFKKKLQDGAWEHCHACGGGRCNAFASARHEFGERRLGSLFFIVTSLITKIRA